MSGKNPAAWGCAVLCGGDGQEREVSLRSGAAVCSALKDAGFDAEILDLRSFDEVEKIKNFDMAFIAMHGDWGEGGRLQEWLKSAKIPYTGSDPEASALAMDKWKARELFKKAELKIPKGLLFKDYMDFKFIISELGDNIVVKPCLGGSSVGSSIIKGVTPENFNQAVLLARQSYNSEILIEEFIEGRELTAAVWERDGKPEALPIIEIRPKAGFYDYSNKYTAGATEYIVPAPLDENIAYKIMNAAIKAHKILGCKDYSRSDFRLASDGAAYLLEVNTAPGMTETSLVPKAAKAAGISLSEFVRHIAQSARF